MRGSKFGYVELDDLLRRIEAGKSPMADDTPAGQGEWGVLKVSAIQAGRFVARENKVVRDAALIHPGYEVRPGDLIMTRANTEELVGLACVALAPPPRLMLSDKTLRLVVDESVADPMFLALVLAQPSLRQRIRSLASGTSGSMKNIGQEQIRRLPVPDVALDEQRRIVAAHEAIERRIAALVKTRTKLAILRNAMVDDLVSGPKMRVGALLTRRPRNGYSPLEVPEWSGLLALGLGCLTAEGFRPRQLKRIPDSDLAHRFLLADGDLLMSRANTRELVGLVGLYKDVGHPCIYPDLMMRLSPDREVCLPEYLELALSTPKLRRAIQAGARGTSESMVKISAEFAESLEVPVPPLEAQRRAVRAVAALDSRIAKQEAAIGKLRVVQQGVMEGLLTGDAKAGAEAPGR